MRYYCNICSKPISKHDTVYKRKFVFKRNRNEYQHYKCYKKENKLWKLTIMPAIFFALVGIGFLAGGIFHLVAVDNSAWNSSDIVLIIIGIIGFLLLFSLIGIYIYGLKRIREEERSKNY